MPETVEQDDVDEDDNGRRRQYKGSRGREEWNKIKMMKLILLIMEAEDNTKKLMPGRVEKDKMMLMMLIMEEERQYKEIDARKSGKKTR
jgi:hypothetical protein